MISLKKLLFSEGTPAEGMPAIQSALAEWRAREAPRLDELHFHVRYLIVDISTSGFKPGRDHLLGLAATSVECGAARAGDAFYADFAAAGADAAVDLRLTAFLRHAAKAPLVGYHVPYVDGFLKHLYKTRLGINFQPQWIDLAWLLPSLFPEKCGNVMPLDHWLEVLGLGVAEGRRDAMTNALLLSRIFQMLLVRAAGKQIDTAERLIDESEASRLLLQAH